MEADMIGMFDSGVGGLSVLRDVRRLLADADLVYLADRANAPYGDKTLAAIRALARRNTEILLARRAVMVVLACNTASVAALRWLRRQYPKLPFVGMEPAVKPGAALSRSGIVGVLATRATIRGQLFADVVARFAKGVEVIPQACPGLADLVEAGEVEGPRVEELLSRYLPPMIDAGADTVVLGCTHYAFLIPVIRRLAGPAVTVVDPSLPVARQVARVAVAAGASAGTGRLEFLDTSGQENLADLAESLAGLSPRPPILR